MLRALSVPAGNERGPIFVEQVFSALHQAKPEGDPVRLVILPSDGEVTLAAGDTMTVPVGLDRTLTGCATAYRVSG